MRVLTAAPLLGFTLTLLAGGCCSVTSAERAAAISRSRAEEIALTKVPDGVVREGELEKEDGVLVWSFDIAPSASAEDVTEVQVDAKTGEIVKIEHESAEDEAHEKHEEHGGHR